MTAKSTTAKPFLKWAGGKGQLLAEIEKRLPPELKDGRIDTYVEPFVGGGAAFFHVAQNYSQIKHFHLFDVNEDLVNCYNEIKHNAKSLIRQLKRIENKFLPLDNEGRKHFFYDTRAQFNSDRQAAKLIFLNKTCYNGLYRVNRKGGFNAPFGDYKNPRICDAKNILSVAAILERAEVVCGDFTESERCIDEDTFVYFDPPYRPLSPTASFTSYSKDSFSEDDQVRLARFCREITAKGAKFLLSNSDPKNEDPTDSFFEKHYERFRIETVKATRAINCKASRRGQINELLITDY
ncbi:MAG: DNA adenine methylase [Planctomycetota bacterium]